MTDAISQLASQGPALIADAEAFAAHAHGSIDQRRKYTGEPYIVHPREVAGIVAAAGGDDAMIAAALLHDTREDVHWVTHRILLDRFGEDVALLVDALTDVSRPEDGNREARKRIDREHIAAASGRAQTIKVADLISNSRSIIERDPDFARVYLPEKRALLAVLTRADFELVQQAQRLVERGIKSLRRTG